MTSMQPRPMGLDFLFIAFPQVRAGIRLPIIRKAYSHLGEKMEVHQKNRPRSTERLPLARTASNHLISVSQGNPFFSSDTR